MNVDNMPCKRFINRMFLKEYHSYKFSSINRICSIMLITTKMMCTCPLFFLKSTNLGHVEALTMEVNGGKSTNIKMLPFLIV